jgi:hypothetical protein
MVKLALQTLFWASDYQNCFAKTWVSAMSKLVAMRAIVELHSALGWCPVCACLCPPTAQLAKN